MNFLGKCILAVLALAGATAINAGLAAQTTAEQPPAGEWKPLFDGKTLKGWKVTDFTAHGEVGIENGAVVIGVGYMTGITYAEPFPKSNYEVRLEAARMEGHDFFAGITFPVKDSFCSWINGGWGGTVVGLSSLEDMDASENETGTYMEFERGKWYRLRLRVTDEAIEAWIDDDQIIHVPLAGRTVGLRWGEIDKSTPFGIATYSTVGAVRKIEYRLLPPPAKQSTVAPSR